MLATQPNSFLAAEVSFRVSSDVEPPAPQVKSVKRGPRASQVGLGVSRAVRGSVRACLGLLGFVGSLRSFGCLEFLVFRGTENPGLHFHDPLAQVLDAFRRLRREVLEGKPAFKFVNCHVLGCKAITHSKM